jgi:hypothetical protein
MGLMQLWMDAPSTGSGQVFGLRIENQTDGAVVPDISCWVGLGIGFVIGLVIGVPIGMRLYWKTGHW